MGGTERHGRRGELVRLSTGSLKPRRFADRRLLHTAATTDPAGTTCCFNEFANLSSSSSSGTATCTNDGTTASAAGVGALTVAQYGSDPVGAPTFSSAGEYFDVALSSGNSFTSATVDDCNLGGGTGLEWWNPQANAGAGALQPVLPTPTYTAGPPAISL